VIQNEEGGLIGSRARDGEWGRRKNSLVSRSGKRFVKESSLVNPAILLILLVSQSDHWIHFRSTARWNVAGKRGDADEQQRDQRERCGISRGDTKQ